MTLTGWMVYSIAVSTLFGAAAWCAERGLAPTRLPTRWLWLVGLLLSVGVPLGGALLPFGAAEMSERAAVAVELEAGIVAQGAGPVVPASSRWGSVPLLGHAADGVTAFLNWAYAQLPAGRPLDRWFLALWATGSTLLALVFGVSGLVMARRRRRWPMRAVRGRRVRVSPQMGPAVSGVFRPEIVLPAWATREPADELEIILAHEDEHLRNRDPQLLGAGLFLVLALPWNAALWWQFRRLRDALEVDCDRRVVAGGAARARYAALLLRLGSRKSTMALPAPALAGSRSLLERRLRAMQRPRHAWTLPASLLAGLVATGMTVVACQADAPEVRAPEAAVSIGEEPPASATAASATDGGAEVDDPDESISPEARSDAIDRSEIEIRTRVDELGVSDTAGDGAPSTAPQDAASEPVFTPFTVAPEVRNRGEIQRSLRQEYPSLLRDAGIGGTVYVWFHIDEGGTVQTVQVRESSGHMQLDDAALRVARTFEFTPAINRDTPVPVWVQIPISFQSR